MNNGKTRHREVERWGGKLSQLLKEAKSKIENRIEIKTETEYEGEVRGVKKRQICRDSGWGSRGRRENRGVTSVFKKRAISCLLFITNVISFVIRVLLHDMNSKKPGLTPHTTLPCRRGWRVGSETFLWDRRLITYNISCHNVEIICEFCWLFDFVSICPPNLQWEPNLLFPIHSAAFFSFISQRCCDRCVYTQTRTRTHKFHY